MFLRVKAPLLPRSLRMIPLGLLFILLHSVLSDAPLITPCIPLPLLNSEGFIAGCEADLQALLGMILARLA